MAMKRTRIEQQSNLQGAISLLSGIREWILSNDDLRREFTDNPLVPGDKISPSTKFPINVFPWIDLAHVGGHPERMSDGVIIDTNNGVQATVYSITYDNCYILGQLVDEWILSAKDQIRYDKYVATLYPMATTGPVREPTREGLTGEVWNWPLKYFAVTGLNTSWTTSATTPNNSGGHDAIRPSYAWLFDDNLVDSIGGLALVSNGDIALVAGGMLGQKCLQTNTGIQLNLSVPKPLVDVAPFSISFWFKATTGSRRIISNGFQILTTDMGDGFNNLLYFNASPIVGGVICTGQWVHVAIVHDGASVVLYVNGVPATPAFAFPVTGSEFSLFGNGPSPSSKIDLLFIYKLALTASQIQLLYNGGVGADYSILY